MRTAGVLLVMLLIALPGFSASAEIPVGGESEQSGMVVSGTLEELDLTRMKGLLKTDLGKPIFFQVPTPQLFERLSVGQKVTIQMDHEGRATKVIDIPVPELKQPLPHQ
ncbi:MAG: hypothetical protein H0W13_09255 [Nitrospirales bacterium]|nr:hypothetical protein [Nitrospirales bacterium]